ncbi:hypothetical protein [Paraglaciecola arctica]|uniref:hypothetical protein n=1 Tax=Paraglaciecola arctica TaxID=1128911 RepID=UPI001C06B4D1|nr:hypothetical protein [Paraglaciecola arctica]MBU3004334.1 hypothetical protein [Paraglaciecola arctica]
MTLTIIAWPKEKNKKNNPFQHLLYEAIEKRELLLVKEFNPFIVLTTKGQKVLHIHWPDVFLATAKGWKFWTKIAYLRVLFWIARILKTPIIWTAHNLKRPGQRNSDILDSVFWPWFSKRIDGIIYMTASSKRNGEELFPNWRDIPNVIIPHGHYGPIIDTHHLKPHTNSDDKPKLLFFGSITKYKNANKLLSAFLNLPEGNAILNIKGKMSSMSPDTLLLQKLEKLPCNRKSEVNFDNRFLSDEELIQSIQESEIIIFPYSDVLNSGAAIFALSVGRPILASDTPLFRELQQQVGSEWVQLINNELDAPQLSLAIKHAKTLKKSKASPDLSKFEWDLIAEQTIAFYQHVLAEKT